MNEEKIKKLEETIEMIKNQVFYCSPSTFGIAIRNMKQILDQHDFVMKELHKK